MFSADERDEVRRDLLEYAARDRRISGGAVTGSAAGGREDRWSDVDLAFGIGDGGDLAEVLSDWTSYIYGKYSALHHLDVASGAWIYRVFLLPGTLQVDVGFVPATEFRAMAPTFRLVFGKAAEARHAAPPPAMDMIGLGWLYALHARTSIARRRLWQAEYMISGVRDHALALACVRHGIPAVHGRGMDMLPREVTAPLKGSLVRELEAGELSRAFRVAVQGLLREIRHADEALAGRLEGALVSMTETGAGSEVSHGGPMPRFSP